MQISNLMKIGPLGAMLFHVDDRRTDDERNMLKLTVPFRTILRTRLKMPDA